MTKPTVPEVLPLMQAYLAIPGNESGGVLHVVLMDGNTETTHVRWCLQEAMRQQDAPGIALAATLLEMSRTQRGRLSALATRS